MRVGAFVLVAAAVLGALGLSACELVAGIENIELTSSASGAGGHAAGSASAESNGSGSTAASSSSSSGPGAACKEIETDPDLVAYYPLDETSGTVAHDCSGHGHDGTVIGKSLAGGWSNGHFSGGFTFDGSSDCIDLGTPAELALENGPFTVAAWVNLKTYASLGAYTNRYIAARATDPYTAGWEVGTNTGSIFIVHYFDATAGDVITQSATGQPTGQWIHVALTLGNGAGKLFQDGALIGTPGAFSSIKPEQGAPLHVGCATGNIKHFDGIMDEVRFYKRGLSDAEVAALAAKVK